MEQIQNKKTKNLFENQLKLIWIEFEIFSKEFIALKTLEKNKLYLFIFVQFSIK